MKPSTIKTISLIAFYLVSIIIVGEWSARSAMKNQMVIFDAQLSKMQAELALRHLQRYSELQKNIESGCMSTVLEKLKISVAIESSLLASELQKEQTNELSQYIEKHAPDLYKTLLAYKSPYGSSWKEPTCN